MNTTTTSRKLHTCKLCNQQFTVVDGAIKRAREVHEAKYCPVYWEQDDADEA